MKVVLSTGEACSQSPRGIPMVNIKLVDALLKRNRYDYALTVFDYKRKQGNIQCAGERFGRHNPSVHICDTAYRSSFNDLNDVVSGLNYNECTGTKADIYMFFANFYDNPINITGRIVNVINDLYPMIFPEVFKKNGYKNFLDSLKISEYNKSEIITVSECTKRDILKFTNIPEEKIHVIPLGNSFVPPPENSDALVKSTGISGEYFLYIGGVNFNKNIPRLIDAFEITANKNKDVRLVLAGGQFIGCKPILEQVEKSFCKDRVLIPGYVGEELKAALYANAAAFVFPSLYEGFGMPVIEAMAYGCPVITSNTSCLPEVAGDAALLVDPYNTEQIAYEMDRVINSKTLRDESAAKGKKQSALYTWERSAEMVEQVYEHVYTHNEIFTPPKFNIPVTSQKKKRALIAGAGRVFENNFDGIANIYDIAGIADKQQKGNIIYGREVIGYEQVRGIDFDIAVVTPREPISAAVIAELIKNGVSENKITILEDVHNPVKENIMKQIEKRI